METKKIIIIGTGGLAREFTDFFADQTDIVGYSSKDQQQYLDYKLPGKFFSGEITPELVGTNLAAIAIGIPQIKLNLYNKLLAAGFYFPSFIHSSAIVAKSAIIKEGVIISPQCVISADVVLNKMSYINCHSAIGHDAIIGSFVQMNGGQIGGFTQIGDYTLIGSGSTIVENLVVGKNITVGSGSTVFTKITDNNITVLGNPAKIFSFKKPIEN